MKKYRIIKFGDAKSIKEALKNESKLDIVAVELVDDSEDTLKESQQEIGFNRK